MHPSVPITISCAIISYIIFRLTRPKTTRICFVGPHSTGKTRALLSLLALTNSTVATLSNHKVLYKDKEVFEIVPNERKSDFAERYGLNASDKFVFFLKNEEEMETFPDCKDFNMTFVMWKKSDKERKGVVYLDESRENLRNLVIKL